MPKKLELKWVAMGKTYARRSQSKPEPIDVYEEEGEMDVATGGQKFGEPVDAQLAIYYIRKLWTEIDESKVMETAKSVKMEGDALIEEFRKKNFTKQDLKLVTKTLDKVEELSLLCERWLEELLSNSFAITMDKGAILKILSQNKCKGIRFYLCMKDLDDSPAIQARSTNPKAARIPGKLTLVSVGVDKDNNDLNYTYEPELHITGDKKVIPKVKNVSLAEEYPFTSSRLLEKPESKELEKYVLYKYSMIEKKETTRKR
ncbi:hypothetical protein ACX0G7_10500 [Flavitalea antarctica]